MKFSLFRKLSQFSIRKQLFIIYIPLVFLSTVLIGLYLVVDSTKQLTDNYQYLADLNAQRVKSVLFDTTNTLYNTVFSLSNNTELRALLSDDFDTDLEAMQSIDNFRAIEEARNHLTAISELTIYTTNDHLPNHRFIQAADEVIQETDWYQRAMTQSSAFLLTLPDDSGVNRLSLVKSLPLPLSDEKAVLAIQLDYNYLRNRLRNSSYYLELQLNDAAIFYSDQIQRVGDPLSLNPDDAFQVHHDDHAIVANNFLSFNNQEDIIHIYSADFEAHDALKSNLIRWSAMVAAVLSVTFFVILLFARFFTHRIQQLQQAVNHAAIEDYDFFQNINGEDEISQISLDFHVILQRIKKKEEEIFQARLAKQELLTQQQQMEFSLLASQINPHFLFNTLETIRMTALISGNTDVAYAIRLLATSMRNTLKTNRTELISLEEELDALHVYVKIQRLRFGDRVNFSYFVDNQLDQQKAILLPLLIQPLIENSITHGLENITHAGYIRLNVTKDAQDIVITVQDNGIGISEDKLLQLQEKIMTPSTDSQKNIGLANVNHRAKLFYGEEYGLSIRSLPSIGTSVVLRIRDLGSSSPTDKSLTNPNPHTQ